MSKASTGFEVIPGGIAAVPGFMAAGVAAGIKRVDSPKKDVAVIFTRYPAKAAAVFTTNKVKAAPIFVTREHLAGGIARAVVVNSGNANACTGEQGMRDARRMASLTGELLGIGPREVIVASTGVIGVPLPMDRVEAGILRAVRDLSETGGASAAQAIMTTDTRPKEVAVRLELQGHPVAIGAMAKGSGMIHPNMATMLGFIATDAAISQPLLQSALRQVVGETFNMLTVDGDTSTNDMVALMANGAAGNPEISGPGADYDLFVQALSHVCRQLARMIARDGEGATKLVTVQVRQAPGVEDARRAAKAVANSNLVKTAIFGADANWGRILTAVGYSGAEFDPAKVDIFLAGERETEQVAGDGAGLRFDEEKARSILEGDEVTIVIDLHAGGAEATAWTCDLSYDYVRINADYRT